MFIVVVPQAMIWLDEAPTKEARIALLVALRDITDGKIFVEAERAKLTRLLAKVRQQRPRERERRVSCLAKL